MSSVSPLYKKLIIKRCNILGFLHHEVTPGNVTIGAFAYKDDAELFVKAVSERNQPAEIEIPAERLEVLE